MFSLQEPKEFEGQKNWGGCTPTAARQRPRAKRGSATSVIIDKPNKDGKKPDFMIGTKVKSKELYFFFVEVKRLETTSKYQSEGDCAKLMKQRKGSVDEQLCLGVQNPSSLGLLVEGFHCTLFQMMLLADGVYMPMAINRFSLIEQSHHLVHLPSIVEAFYFVECELNNFVVKVNEKETNEEKRIGREGVRFSFETKFEIKTKAKKKKTHKTNK
ncbi:unnamed protein product [Mucor circinelloides]